MSLASSPFSVHYQQGDRKNHPASDQPKFHQPQQSWKGTKRGDSTRHENGHTSRCLALIFSINPSTRLSISFGLSPPGFSSEGGHPSVQIHQSGLIFLISFATSPSYLP